MSTTPTAEATEPIPEPAHKPLYRSRRAWIVAIVALVAGAGLALGLLFTVFAGSTPTPESTLVHDGYRVSASLNQQQVSGAVSGSASGVTFLKGTFTGAATGTKGGTTEVAFGLAKGQAASTVLTEVQQNVGQGVTARTEGSFLVMSGPAASFSGTGSQALGFAPTPESVVSHDGYTVITSMDQQEVDNAIKAAPAADQVSFLKGMFTGAAVGTNGGSEEVAFGLTPKGQTVISTLLPAIQAGAGVSTHMEGSFLVMSGTASQFNGTGSAALGF